MAKAYRCRPSELLGIELGADPDHDAYIAWMVDRAVRYFGISVEQDMDEKSEGLDDKPVLRDNARQQVLDRYLYGDQVVKGRFADPAQAMKR